ncbi:fibronectin type III domain-containing protein [Streptomyces sp. SID13031]|uniref:fibronectin type III domain-containing protein n=1 Tax=Streptomyces sp. SID13031 TaxID=2706046 RepID=UPI0013C99527|nr:fibronectin type III domain-containing protein [Streptomyces sp. SID13031]NEA31136.1 fibronectin type III domain-containing protein [Streptomyces sp. SID13031]
MSRSVDSVLRTLMKKAVLVLVTAVAVIAAALIPSGRPVEAATSGFGSALSAVKQVSWQTNSSVNALAVAGNTVYAGGLFTRIRQPGQPLGQGDAARSYIAAFNRTTGVPTRFAPKLNGPVWSIATSPDGKWVVIGGDFTTVDGVKRSHLAMFSVATGKLVAGWDPVVAYRVSAIAIGGNSVYFGGSFGRVDNTERNNVAAVTLSTGVLLPWDPDADDDVYAIDLSDNGTRVFVGGGFSELKNNDHYALAMVNTTTGDAYTMPAAAAIPEPDLDCQSRVKDIDTLGSKVFVSNAGSGRGCYDGVLAADATSGKLLWQNNCLGATEAIKAIGNWLYKGSHAHDCSRDGGFKDGTGNHHLLVESTTTGKLGPWYPNTDYGGETEVGPLAFASGGNDLWVGGDFTRVNGGAQQGLTRFTNTPGGARPTLPAAPAASSTRAGKATVSFPTVVDADNIALTYTLFRGSTKLASWKRSSYSWVKPAVTTFSDTRLPSGKTVSYRVQVSDGRNVRSGAAVAVKIR